jgi:dienelactone hydrolase
MKKRIAMGVALALAAVVLGALAKKAYSDRHFYDGYDPKLALNAAVSDPTQIDGTVKAFGQQLPAHYRRERVELDVRPGERMPAILTLPVTDAGPVPVIVLLHGSHQEKEFVEEICTPFNEAGFAMVCFDQYMRGERKMTGNPIAIAAAYRERCWKTVHDSRRLIDYLQTRPDIAAGRIYLVGASYGAITGTAVVAQERRIKAAVLVVGGGNLGLLAQAPEIRREIPAWLQPFAAPLVRFIAGPADPLLHAAATAGIPVLMQNGSNDRIVIPEAGKALFAALGEPKELRWYPINHPDREPKGEEVIKMLGDGLKWLVDQDAKYRQAGTAVPEHKDAA